MTETPTMSMTPQQAQEKAREIMLAHMAAYPDAMQQTAAAITAALIAAHNEAVERCAEVADSDVAEARDDMAAGDIDKALVGVRLLHSARIAKSIRTLKVEEQP